MRDRIEEILEHGTVWLCATCYTCLERCPQRIELSEIFMQLKNAAARSGLLPEGEIKKSLEILKTGWTQTPTKRTAKVRSELGLPAVPDGIGAEELVALASCLGWKEKLGLHEKDRAQTPGDSHDRPALSETGGEAA